MTLFPTSLHSTLIKRLSNKMHLCGTYLKRPATVTVKTAKFSMLILGSALGYGEAIESFNRWKNLQKEITHLNKSTTIKTNVSKKTTSLNDLENKVDKQKRKFFIESFLSTLMLAAPPLMMKHVFITKVITTGLNECFSTGSTSDEKKNAPLKALSIMFKIIFASSLQLRVKGVLRSALNIS